MWSGALKSRKQTVEDSGRYVPILDALIALHRASLPRPNPGSIAP